jgi:hypothetical protein
MNANIAEDVLVPGFEAGRIEPVTNRGVHRNAHGFQRGLQRPDQDPFHRRQEALRRELRRRQEALRRRQEELRRQQEGGQPQQHQEEEENEE